MTCASDEPGSSSTARCASLSVERLLPEGQQSSPAPLDDLNMLVLLPGRERTGRQYGELLEAAGLRLDRIMDTSSGMQVIEARATA